METDVTERIEYYLLHDPIGNVEGAVTEYDAEKLAAAEKQGAVFIAVYSSGRRELVRAADIEEPEPVLNGISLVQPVYVDDRMKAAIEVFEALESVVPAVAASRGGVGKPTFSEALASLKALVYGEED